MKHISYGILICSGGFTKGVFYFVKGLPVQLIDLDSLLHKVNELIPQQIGEEEPTDIVIQENIGKDIENINDIADVVCYGLRVDASLAMRHGVFAARRDAL
jgi:hypothetical protein